jgi:hypothetical protein
VQILSPEEELYEAVPSLRDTLSVRTTEGTHTVAKLKDFPGYYKTTFYPKRKVSDGVIQFGATSLIVVLLLALSIGINLLLAIPLAWIVAHFFPNQDSLYWPCFWGLMLYHLICGGKK